MLKISQPDYDALRHHGEETYPHECCGVLLGNVEGEVRTVRAVVRAGNTRTDSAHNRYNIDPRELVRIQREARESEFDIVGFYHSHPDHPALWSPTDLAEAHWVGCSYVITSVDLGKAVTTNSFVLAGTSEDDKQFRPEPVQVVEGSAVSAATPDAAEVAPLRDGQLNDAQRKD
jgi:proteasome lid subunit RPN8/RPN11